MRLEKKRVLADAKIAGVKIETYWSWDLAGCVFGPAGRPPEQTAEPQITQKKVSRWPVPGSAIPFPAGEGLLGTG
jgi:hypothetical protein